MEQAAKALRETSQHLDDDHVHVLTDDLAEQQSADTKRRIISLPHFDHQG